MATYAVPEIRNTCTRTPNLLLLKLLTFLKTGLCNTNLTVNMLQQSKLILSSSNNTNEKDKTCLDKGRSTSHSSEDYFKTNILQDPKLFLSGLYSEKHNYSRNKRAFIDLSLFHAKKTKRAALLWTKIHRPSTTQWIRRMLSNLSLERITCILKDKQQVFENIWSPFIDYIKDLDLTDEMDD